MSKCQSTIVLSMTLTPMEVKFFVQWSSSRQDFSWHSASRGFFAIAELLVQVITDHFSRPHRAVGQMSVCTIFERNDF